MSQQIVEAACLTRHIDPAQVKSHTIVGDDLFLLLLDGSMVRVELSALPAELTGEAPETDQLTEPTPEHTTLTEPKPATLGSTQRGVRARAKKKGRK